MLPFRKKAPCLNLRRIPGSDRIDRARRKLWLSDDDFQSEMLEGVSRTFALTIPQLPGELCRVVSNAYLLCRIVDTIEDEPVLSGTQKNSFGQQFLKTLNVARNAEPFSRHLWQRSRAKHPGRARSDPQRSPCASHHPRFLRAAA